jgi:DNA-binding MarR family transcriptional regulator
MPRAHNSQTDAAGALVAVAPLVSRWIERLLAQHEPALTVTQYLALRAIATDGLSGAELAKRAGVSGPAVSQLLAGLAAAGLLERREFERDRRRQTLSLSRAGERARASAEALLRQRLGSLLGELRHPDAEALARVLPRVEAALAGAAPPRRPPPPPPPLGGPRRRP